MGQFGVILNHFWVIFGVILASLWKDFGIVPGSFSGLFFCIVFASFWGRFGVCVSVCLLLLAAIGLLRTKVGHLFGGQVKKIAFRPENLFFKRTIRAIDP